MDRDSYYNTIFDKLDNLNPSNVMDNIEFVDSEDFIPFYNLVAGGDMYCIGVMRTDSRVVISNYENRYSLLTYSDGKWINDDTIETLAKISAMAYDNNVKDVLKAIELLSGITTLTIADKLVLNKDLKPLFNVHTKTGFAGVALDNNTPVLTVIGVDALMALEEDGVWSIRPGVIISKTWR